jgi:hypothetical protein
MLYPGSWLPWQMPRKCSLAIAAKTAGDQSSEAGICQDRRQQGVEVPDKRQADDTMPNKWSWEKQRHTRRPNGACASAPVRIGALTHWVTALVMPLTRQAPASVLLVQLVGSGDNQQVLGRKASLLGRSTRPTGGARIQALPGPGSVFVTAHSSQPFTTQNSIFFRWDRRKVRDCCVRPGQQNRSWPSTPTIGTSTIIFISVIKYYVFHHGQDLFRYCGCRLVSVSAFVSQSGQSPKINS